MPCQLHNLLHAAWLQLQPKLAANPTRLLPRLQRRANTRHIPRSLCLALRAADRRLAPSPQPPVPHTLHLTAEIIRQLCRPVELYWSQRFRHLALQLGTPRQAPRRLEKRGLLRARRIPGLAGQRGLPVPLVDSPVPATAPQNARWEDFGHPSLLDPGATGHSPPHPLLIPYWLQLSTRLPHTFQQTLHRHPIFRTQRGQHRFIHWSWHCPHCQNPANTLYLPIGAPDFAAAIDIQLPNLPNLPTPPLTFACKRCHPLFNLAQTPKSIAKSWSLLIAHMSGGLLFGHEVPRPASFAALRPNKPHTAPRSAPRRDQLESYLVTTNLTLRQIAHRMNWTYAAVNHELHLLCKKRRLKGGRRALKRHHLRHHPLPNNSTAAA